MTPDRIDPNDFDSVVWLQKALTMLLPYPQPMMVGQLDFMVWKAIRQYQELHGLEPTTLPASAHRARPPQLRTVPLMVEQSAVLATLLPHLQQQLKERGLTIS